MIAACYASIDETLLLLSEARERAEGAAAQLAAADGPTKLVEALVEADRELHALHRRLFERAYLGRRDAPEQLELGSLQS